MLVGNAGRCRRGFHVGDIGLHKFFAAIFDRADANHRCQRNDRTTEHRLFEILLIIFRKGSDFLLERRMDFGFRVDSHGLTLLFSHDFVNEVQCIPTAVT